jgi:hypothetical protein
VSGVVKVLICVVLIVAAGCATRDRISSLDVLPVGGDSGTMRASALAAVGRMFPVHYRAAHRAIVTVQGRQFTCDGLLTVSPTEGYHLALVSSFGVVTDLRINPDRSTELLKVTPLFRADWSRDFVARDLRVLFVSPASLSLAGKLADGRSVFAAPRETDGTEARYVFGGAGWQELELRRDGKTVYHATIKHRRKFAPGGPEIPDTFEVVAESYRLDLRVAALAVEVMR